VPTRATRLTNFSATIAVCLDGATARTPGDGTRRRPLKDLGRRFDDDEIHRVASTDHHANDSGRAPAPNRPNS
jgi:hypothetical protein